MRGNIMYSASTSVIFCDQIQVPITFSLAIFVNINKGETTERRITQWKNNCVEGMSRIDTSEN